MIRNAIALVVLSILVFASTARAADGFGLGLILGEPTGISVKNWISPERAIDAAAAWSLEKHQRFQFHADYLIHQFDWLKPDNGRADLPVYYGIGGRVRLTDNDNDNGHDSNDSVIGVRVPFGLSFLPASAPLEFFIEIVPILDVLPDTDVDINGAFGFRFYFR